MKVGIKYIMAIFKKYFVIIYFILLLLLILWIYFPTFFHPPRSDHWSALYYFFRVDNIIEGFRLKYLMIYDPLINTTFRPLSFLIPYFEYHLFDGNWIYDNIINFALYFVTLILFYNFVLNFCKNRMLIISFITLFAFLFSHFDIVAWSFHSHIILSFNLFLTGFLLYIKYLKTKRIVYFISALVLFLTGMLLYEVYLFWPLAIIILTSIFQTDDSPNKRYKVPVSGLIVLYSVYSTLYFINYHFRNLIGMGISLNFLFSMQAVSKTILSIFFNMLYLNIVNIYPKIAYPLRIDENLNMGGILTRYEFAIDKIVLVGGIIAAIVFIIWILSVWKKRDLKNTKICLFFIFLIFSELFVLFHCKYLVNPGVYNFIQFRFQYIPNAIFFMLLTFVLDKYIKGVRIRQYIFFVIMGTIIVSNIYSVRAGISVIDKQLKPLNKLLNNIKVGFKNGKINCSKKLYLDDNIALSLPSLCWNREMGIRCMRGTYQWIFSKEEIKCFSTYEESSWVVDKESLSLIPKVGAITSNN